MKYGLNFIKKLCSLKKEQVQIMLVRYLKNKGYTNVKSTNMYIIAEGELPVCLLAHMDTVFARPPRTFYFDSEQSVMWSPDGLGADDRAGIYVIINLIERGYKPSLIFTDLEEKGGVGANALVSQYPDCPFSKPCNALIQLDRQGENDAVFYNCENDDFTDLIESYGFLEEFGTFTDISIIAPAWGIAAVNLSVGYYDEHSYVETLNMKQCHATIDKVENMLKDCGEWLSYVYIPAPPRQHMYYNAESWWLDNCCYYCGKPLKENEGHPIPPGNNLLLCDNCYEFYEEFKDTYNESPKED